MNGRNSLKELRAQVHTSTSSRDVPDVCLYICVRSLKILMKSLRLISIPMLYPVPICAILQTPFHPRWLSQQVVELSRMTLLSICIPNDEV